MQRRPTRFCSDRLLLDGDLWLPDDASPDAPRPAVLTCSGYQGFKGMHPERFARMLVPRGYVCLSFDYRGFGESEGERGRLVPQDQVEDVRAAVALLADTPEVDADRIGLIGWAFGGGVVVTEAADDPLVAAVVVLNGIGDGERVLRAMHDDAAFDDLRRRVATDRLETVQRGRSQRVDPFEIVRLDAVTGGYVDEQLVPYAGFGAPVTLASVDHILRFRPEQVVHRIAPRPVLVVHGDRNGLHPPSEAESLVARAGDPCRLEWLEGAGHTEWMHDDHPTFQHVVGVVSGFLDEHLRGGG